MAYTTFNKMVSVFINNMTTNDVIYAQASSAGII